MKTISALLLIVVGIISGAWIHGNPNPYQWFYPFFFNPSTSGRVSQQAYFTQSIDGKTFTTRPGISYSPALPSSVRDPYFFYYTPNQTLYMAYTYLPSGTLVLNNGTQFAITKTTDCQTFSSPVLIDVSNLISGGNAGVWGPAFFLDDNGDVYIYFAASSNAAGDTGFQIGYVKSTDTLGLTTWGTPTFISGSGLPSNMIGNFTTSPSKSPNGLYNIWTKDETTKYTIYLSSSSPTTGYTQTTTGDWAGWGSHIEGAYPLSLGGNSWRMIIDNEGNGSYYSENANNWTAGSWSAKTLLTTPYSTPNSVNGGMIPMPPICH